MSRGMWEAIFPAASSEEIGTAWRALFRCYREAGLKSAQVRALAARRSGLRGAEQNGRQLNVAPIDELG